MERTSTKHAPWYVIPSNHKWFRNLAMSQIVADTLEDMEPEAAADAGGHCGDSPEVSCCGAGRGEATSLRGRSARSDACLYLES